MHEKQQCSRMGNNHIAQQQQQQQKTLKDLRPDQSFAGKFRLPYLGTATRTSGAAPPGSSGVCLPHYIVYDRSAAENICSVIFPKRLGQFPRTSSIFRISFCAPQDKFIVNLYWDSKHSDSNY